MNVEWGQRSAWEWAIAHEGANLNKNRDSICDMANNSEGNVIGVRAVQLLEKGKSASYVKQYISDGVVANIKKGNYCRR